MQLFEQYVFVGSKANKATLANNVKQEYFDRELSRLCKDLKKVVLYQAKKSFHNLKELLVV